jgi:ABC-type proline/glycine betaine transport system permease subunit
MSKSDLRGRPMFDYTRDAIEAHLSIVFTALAVAHAIQSRTGLSISKVIKQLRPLRSATISINGTTQTFPSAIPEAQREILTRLAVKPGY